MTGGEEDNREGRHDDTSDQPSSRSDRTEQLFAATAEGLPNPHGGCHGNAKRKHESRGGAGDGNLVRGQRHRPEMSDEQGGGGEGPDLTEQLQTRGHAQPEQGPLLTPPLQIRFPAHGWRAAPGEDEPNQTDNNHHATDQGGPSGALQSQSRCSQVAVNQNPIEKHVEPDASEHDPKGRPRTRLAVEVVPRGGGQPGGNERPRHDQGVSPRALDHAGSLTQIVEKRINEVHGRRADHPTDDRESDPGMKSAGHRIGASRAVRMGNAHRDGGEHAEAGNGKDHQNVVGKRASGQGHGSDVPDHDDVRHPEQHLPDLTGRDGRRQPQGRA